MQAIACICPLDTDTDTENENENENEKGVWGKNARAYERRNILGAMNRLFIVHKRARDTHTCSHYVRDRKIQVLSLFFAHFSQLRRKLS